MYFHDAVEWSRTLRRTHHLGGDDLSFSRQFLDSHRNMLVLINFLKGFDVLRTWVHHDKLCIWHAILLIESSFELHYFCAALSLPKKKISPPYTWQMTRWRSTAASPSARVSPGANR